jgi:DNA-binding CsgD family transcriptional regulator
MIAQTRIDPLPRLDASDWSHLASQVLEAMRIGVVAMGHRREIVSLTPTATRLLHHFGGELGPGATLPDPIAAAARLGLAGRPQPVRAETPGGEVALYVTTTGANGLPLVAAVIWLHQEVVHDPALLGALRARYALSARELQLVEQVRLGYSNQQIAWNLGLTVGTVGTYLHNLFAGLGVHSRVGLLALVERLRRDA